MSNACNAMRKSFVFFRAISCAMLLVVAVAGISSPAFARIVTIMGTSGDDDIEVVATGATSGFYIFNGSAGTFLDADAIIVDGGDGDDRFTFTDSSSGAFAPALGVTFNGGGNGSAGDVLFLSGGFRESVTHTFLNASDGKVDLRIGDLTMTISYTGLEPVVDDTLTDHMAFNYLAGAETISLSASSAGRGLIDSTHAESVDFPYPGSTLTVVFDPQTDAFNNLGLGNDFAAQLLVNPPIPEPDIYALLTIGLVLVGSGLRRQRAAGDFAAG